jgi:phosphohistidine phosphatase
MTPQLLASGYRPNPAPFTSLWLIRHGPAGNSDPARWPDDGERPLTKRGRSRLKTLRRWLAHNGVTWDHLLTSPLLRCQQSARLLQKCCPQPLQTAPLLAPASDIAALWQQLQSLAGSVAVVGHSPDLELLAAQALGLARPCLTLPKAAILKITVSDGSQPASLELLLDARLLKD